MNSGSNRSNRTLAGLTALLGLMTLSIIQVAVADDRRVEANVILVNPGPIVAGGGEQSLLFVATNDYGQPARDVSFRGTEVDVGKLGEWSQQGPGMWGVTFKVKRSAEVDHAVVTIQARVEGARIEKQVTLPVVRSPSITFSIVSNPDRLTLGVDESAQLTIWALSAAGTPLDGLELDVDASLGRAGKVRPLGDGKYEVDYRPPDSKRPSLAIFSVNDKAAPQDTYAFFYLPLASELEWKLKTREPNAEVKMIVDGQTYGPVTADEDGVALVPIRVPAGIVEGTALIACEDGTSADPMSVDLKPPPFKRVKLSLTEPFLPGDGVSTMPIYLTVVGDDGRPLDDAKLQMAASVGEFGELKGLGNGMYKAEYMAPKIYEVTDEKIAVSLAEQEKLGVEYGRFTLIPGLPAALQFTTDPPEVQEGGSVTLKLEGKVVGTAGDTPDDFSVTFIGPGGELESQRQEDGSYTTEFEANFDAPVGLAADVVLDVPEQIMPVVHVLAWAMDDQVPLGGQTALVAMAVDRFGIPVAGVQLKASSAQGEVSSGGQTDRQGRHIFTFDASDRKGLAVVEITDGEHTFACPLLQYEIRTEGFNIPPHGGAVQARLLERWAALHSRRLVGKGAPPPSDVAALPPSLVARDSRGSTGGSAEPWWFETDKPQFTSDLPLDELAVDLKKRLATGDQERQSLHRVELVPISEDQVDIVVYYSHEGTEIRSGSKTIQPTKEEWFAGWAGKAGKFAKSKKIDVREFWLFNMDDDHYLSMGIDDCRTLGGMSGQKALDYVEEHAASH